MSVSGQQCDICGHHRSKHKQFRDAKPPHCPAVPHEDATTKRELGARTIWEFEAALGRV